VYRKLHLPAALISTSLVVVAVSLSLFLTCHHLTSYTNPSEQKWIVAVISMVPVYATESIISLWSPKLSLYCDILRNCYEAFALYAFGRYLIACLGGEAEVEKLLEDEGRNKMEEPLLEIPPEEKTFRNFFFRPCRLGRDLFNIIRFGLVQYMILKTLCAFLAFILEMVGVYGNGNFKWYYGYPYITIVMNFSQMWALYCLVQFYNVTYQRLQPIKPLAKFISFKAIVFATWWQGVGIVLLGEFKVFPKEEKFQAGLQDFLICIEMAMAAVAHIFVFSARPYRFVMMNEKPTATTAVVVEKKETTLMDASGTSVKESVEDIVVQGGHKVVKDVVLTINQAIEPVQEGMTKIQEKFHKTTLTGDDSEIEVEVDKEEE
ncbi:hypothetical protein M569_14147, partial [Genlisea aurea]